MDSDFFGGNGETTIQQQQYAQEHFMSQDNAPDDEFEFSDPARYESIETVQQNVYPSSENDVESIRKIQEEEARIQTQLREKADRQYEEKQKRKEAGRKQLEQFLAKKQKEADTRKEENIQKQKQLLEKNARLSKQAGWRKVAQNVALKQGQNKGQKDITRMRESIINKKNDETN